MTLFKNTRLLESTTKMWIIMPLHCLLTTVRLSYCGMWWLLWLILNRSVLT